MKVAGRKNKMKKTAMDRFLEKVKISTSTGCWEWLGAKSNGGYGIFSFNGKPIFAHRFSYGEFIGSIPARSTVATALEIDHLCRNRACVNPWHLELVTRKENLRRGEHYWSDKTHCKNGHEFNEENTHSYVAKNGRVRRVCRACHNALIKRIYSTPEGKVRHAEINRVYMTKAHAKEKDKERKARWLSNPENIQKQRDACKAYRYKRASTPEGRQRQKDYDRLQYLKRKAKGVCHESSHRNDAI